MGDDDIDTEPDEFFGELLGTVASPLRIAKLDLDIPAFRIAKSGRPRQNASCMDGARGARGI